MNESDFDDTYFPVPDQESIRIAVSLTTVLQLNVYQLDLKTAYLQVPITKISTRVLMSQY